MTPSLVLIKKYGNRRLYDTTSSRYVNLEDIAALIRAGKDVQVVDARTSQDLTRVILTQIITEDAKDQPTGLPLELLRQLIVASDHVGREFIMWYLKSAFEAYHKVQNAMQTRLSDMQSVVLGPMQTVRRLLGMPAGQETDAEPESELEGLRRRVAELQAVLETIQPPAQTGKRRARPDSTPVAKRKARRAAPGSVAPRRHAGSRGRSAAEPPVRRK